MAGALARGRDPDASAVSAAAPAAAIRKTYPQLRLL